MATDCIWVVEDDPSVGRALMRMLRALGIDCELCISGDDLLARIGSARPTFVLLDIHMPRISGIEALRHLRARGIDVPVVMMTGVERDGIRETCLAAGAADMLPKPVDARTITTLLDRLTGRAHRDHTA
jgi:CheY-like chemotaxis protein